MSNIAIESIRSGNESRIVTLPENGVTMLRANKDFMMHEGAYLKKIVSAAALLVARLDRVSLPGGAAMAALTLAGLIEGMPEGMVSESMSSNKSS